MSLRQDRSAARRRALAITAPLAAVVAAAVLASAPAAHAKAPAGFYGVTPTISPTDADLARMGKARVGTLGQ